MSIVPEYIEKLNNFFSHLPGIGSKTANRLAFHLLSQEKTNLNDIAGLFAEIERELNFCQNCSFFARRDEKYCSICRDVKRNENQMLVVENRIDVVAIEELNFYKGKYHILGGLISPLKNILPENLNINKLGERLKLLDKDLNESIEIILAINTNIEGEATSNYLKTYIDSLKLSRVEISMLARGLPTGADLDYTDKDTLQNSFFNRGRFT